MFNLKEQEKKWVSMTDRSTVSFAYTNEQCMFLLRAFVTNNEAAGDLIRVQDAVLSLRCLKTGNRGIYPESWGSEGALSDQTYCNHAVFLTVLGTDSNHINFTGYANGKFPEPLFYSCRRGLIPRPSGRGCRLLFEGQQLLA